MLDDKRYFQKEQYPAHYDIAKVLTEMRKVGGKQNGHEVTKESNRMIKTVVCCFKKNCIAPDRACVVGGATQPWMQTLMKYIVWNRKLSRSQPFNPAMSFMLVTVLMYGM